MSGLLCALLVVGAGASAEASEENGSPGLSATPAVAPVATPPLDLTPHLLPVDQNSNGQKSSLGALGLSLACELPTALFGPSCGHLYAGEEAHFFFTGGLRVADFLALLVLEKWGPGVPPLFDVLQTHVSRSLAAEPFAYPLDLALVLLWWGTAVYDLVDSVFAVHRANLRARLRAVPVAAVPLAPTAPPGFGVLRF